MDKVETSGICRVCLVPEDERTEKFSSIFENNADLAFKIFKVSGTIILDINVSKPSLICKKCVNEVEFAEKLKMRILDADEYYGSMTVANEKIFLDDIKTLINENPATPKVKAKKEDKIEKGLKRVNQSIGAEIFRPQKRKFEVADIGQCENFTPKLVGNRTLKSTATPNKLGIHRTIVNSKKNNLNVRIKNSTQHKLATVSVTKKSPKSKPLKSSAKRSSKSKNKKLKGGVKKITFECDSCKATFTTITQLNDHLESHQT